MGQAMMALCLSPPAEGGPSWELYNKERSGILNSLQRKAKLTSQRLNAIPHMSCQPIDGAMYAFPRIELPESFIAQAKAMGKAPDFLWCLQLLERTGVVCVPGSGFGQAE